MSSKKKHPEIKQEKGMVICLPGVTLNPPMKPADEYDMFESPQERALYRILLDEKERQATFLGEKSRQLELNFQKSLQRLRDNTLLICRHCEGMINFFDPQLNALSGCGTVQ